MQESQVHFKHLNSLEERISVFPLYHQLNPRLEENIFHQRMAEMMEEPGYRILAGYDRESLVALSGYWISHKLYCGKYLEPDNVVVHRSYRSLGIGDKLHAELEKIALEQSCRVMMLDAYLDNSRGHQFYERLGYVKKGFHFIKKL